MRQDFVLAPEATISGRVLDATGTPVVGASVAIDIAGPGERVLQERGVSLTTVTDAAGQFRVVGLPDGEWMVSAMSPTAAVRLVVRLETSEDRTVDLRLNPTGVVRGRVVSRARPIAGVRVAAGAEVAVSQSDGLFVLARVPVGEIELETAPLKRTSGPVRVVEGDRNLVEVVVDPMGSLRGVVRRQGRPVPGGRVVINGPINAGATADSSGRYEVSGLEAGTYSIYADDRRRSAMIAEDRIVEVAAGQTRDHDIELAWGGRIAGHVLDRRGDPVAGVAVLVRGGMNSECLSDDAGAFSCGALAPGTYLLSARPMIGDAHPLRIAEPIPGLIDPPYW